MRLVEAEGGTITHGFDTHYKEYLDSLERTPRDISSLRFGTFPSGMTSSARIARRVQTEMLPTFTGWGMTETFHLRHHVLRQLDRRSSARMPRAIRRRDSRSRS